MTKLLLTFAATTAPCLAADPFVGTWKDAQLDKWKISPGGRAEESKLYLVTTELIAKDTYRDTTTTLDGKPVEKYPPYTFVLDGKEHKDSANTTSKRELISERHTRRTITGDKGTVIEDLVVSQDGKTATLTRKGTGTTSGRHVDELFIYEKQPAKGR